MKRTFILSSIAVVACLALMSTLAPAQEKPWFDVKNCQFCKQFAEQPGLMDHMTSEYHSISDGIVSLTHIDKGYDDEFKKAQDGVKKVITDITTTGKVPYMCQHCSMLGQFAMAHVRQEPVITKYGILVVYTSPDTAMVSTLHMFGKRTGDELEKINAEKAAPKEK